MKKKSFEELKDGFGVFGVIIFIAAVAILGGSFLYLRELKRLKNLAAPPATQTPQENLSNTQAEPAVPDTPTTTAIKKIIKKASPSVPDEGEIETRFLQYPQGVHRAGDTLPISWNIRWSDGSSYTSSVSVYLVSLGCEPEKCLRGKSEPGNWPLVIAIDSYGKGDSFVWTIPKNVIPSGKYRIVLFQGSEAAGRNELLTAGEPFEIIGGFEYTTYQNGVLKFRFKYPSHFIVQELDINKDEAELLNLAIRMTDQTGIPIQELIRIGVSKNIYSSLDAWVNSLYIHVPEGDEPIPIIQDATVETISVSGISAKRVIPSYGLGGSIPTTYFLRDNQAWEVTISALDPFRGRYKRNYFLEIEKQLLASFEFLQ